MNTQACCGLAGLLFGHKFRARYDETKTYPKETAKFLEIALSRITASTSILLPDDVRALESINEGFRYTSDDDSFYVQDVCQRCGLVVDRPADPIEQTETDELIEIIGQRLSDSGPFERARVMDSIRELTKMLKSKMPVESTGKEDGEEDDTHGIPTAASCVTCVTCVKCFKVYADDEAACPHCGCARP